MKIYVFGCILFIIGLSILIGRTCIFIKKTEKEISDIKVRYLGKFEEDDFAIKDVREHLKITNGIKGSK